METKDSLNLASTRAFTKFTEHLQHAMYHAEKIEKLTEQDKDKIEALLSEAYKVVTAVRS